MIYPLTEADLDALPSAENVSIVGVNYGPEGDMLLLYVDDKLLGVAACSECGGPLAHLDFAFIGDNVVPNDDSPEAV